MEDKRSKENEPAAAVTEGLKPWLVELKTPCVYYDETFLSGPEADELYAELKATLRWETNSSINRMTALHGEIDGDAAADESQYHYKDAPSLQLQPWTEPLMRVKQRVEQWYSEKTCTVVTFNVCLGNYYIDGQNRIGWHTDREEVGRTTPIASVSLGAPRRFLLRGMTDREDSAALQLANGSLTIMENVCQHRYVHCVPREQDVSDGRINLTFRCKHEVTDGEQQHADSRDRVLGGANLTAVEAAGDAASSNAAALSPAGSTASMAAVAAQACFAAFLAVRYSRRDSPGAAISTDLALALAAAPVAIGVAHGIACAWSAAALGSRISSQPSTGAAVGSDQPQVIPAFLVVCQMGIEDIVEEEIMERLRACGVEAAGSPVICRWGVRGVVAVASEGDKTQAALLGLRTANYVLAFHDCFNIPPITLESSQKGAVRIYNAMAERLKKGLLVVAPLAAGVKTFRTSCDRSGKHDFSSQEVEYEAGGALQEFYGTKCKMKKPDVTVRIGVTGELVFMGTQLHEDDLAKRRKYKFVNRVTLKSNLAACMLRKANLLAPRPGTRMLDMFCGSGTVLLEWVGTVRCAEAAAKGDSGPVEIEAVGIDVSLGAVNGARANAEAESVEGSCNFIKCDAKAMRKELEDGSFDAIVTNVPWGVQTGNDAKVDLEKLYEMVLRNSWHLLRPKGRIVMLVLRGLQVLQILRRLSFRFKILEMRVVKTANNLPTLFVLERVESDKEYDQLKAELYALGDYVSMGTSTFMAVHSASMGSGDQLSGFKRSN